MTVVVVMADDEEKWHCFVCNAEPLADLVRTCSDFIGRHLSALRGARNVKRRKSAHSAVDTAQKRLKSTPGPSHGKQTPIKGRPNVAQMPVVQQATASPKSVVNGGLMTIERPKYDADMMPVNEHNVWPVVEKLLAATQSMSMLLGSLKDDLKRSSTLAANRTTSEAAASGNVPSELTVKRKEAAVKLWRAFDAYQKSFVDIETYSRETSTAANSSEMVNCDAGGNSVSSSSAAASSGTGSNLKVEGNKVPEQSADRKILKCPSTFLWCPPT